MGYPRRLLKKNIASSSSPSTYSGLVFPGGGVQPTENITPFTDEQRRERDAQLRTQRQATLDVQSKQLSKIYNSLSPSEQADFNKAQQIAATRTPDRLSAPTAEELQHQQWMDAHPVLGAVRYLGAKTSKGAVQIAKGAAHIANIATNPGAAMTGNDPSDAAFDAIDKAANLGLSKTDFANIEQGNGTGKKALSAAGMAAEFAPSVLGGEAMQSPKALLFLQGVGQGKETADKLDIKNPLVKEGLIQGSGVVNLLLSDLGDNVFGKLPSAMRNNIVTGIAADAIKESAGKDITTGAFKKLLEDKTADFLSKFPQYGLKQLEHFNNNAATFTKLNVANFALHKGVDELNDKPVFNETLGNLAENIQKGITQDAPIFSAIGAAKNLSKLTPYSGYKNDVIESVIKDPSEQNIGQIKEQINNHASQEGWTQDEADATLAHVDKIAQAAKAIPATSNPAKRADAIDLVMNRNDLQAKLDAAKAEKGTQDASIADIVSPKEQYLTDKIEQANDKLRSMVTGDKTTYSKVEEPEKETKYFKTTDGKKEAITKDRYNLEKLERNEKANNQETVETDAKAKEAEVLTNQEEKNNENTSNSNEGIQAEIPVREAEKAMGSLDHAGNGTDPNTEAIGGVAEIPKPPETQEATPTGIRNEDVATEREVAIPRESKKLDDVHAEGRRLVDSGELDPEELARKINKGQHTANEEEQAALRYHKTKLNNRQRKLLKDSEENPENAASNHIEYSRGEDLLEQNRQATERIGNVAGRTLRDRQEQLAEDYSRVTVLSRAKQANHGEPLSPELEKELSQRSKRIEELESKLADRELYIRKMEEQNTLNKVGDHQRKSRREVTRQKLREERQELLAELHVLARKARSSAGANKIPVEMLPVLTKLAVNYVADGLNTLSVVADKVYNDLKEHLDGVNKEDIEDAIRDGFDGYVREQNDIRLNRAKKRQQTKLDELQSGNYEKRVYSKIQVDNDYLKIRAEINREQTLVNRKIAEVANSQKSTGRRISDFAVRYGRQAKLASITVLGKLAATGLTTAGLKSATEGIGKGLSAILPKIAKKSTVEGSVSASAMRKAAEVTGGASVSNLAQAYARAATEGMKDAYNELNIKKGGQSDLSALYGKYSATRLPAEAADFFGHLHSAIKAPIKRFAWEHSYAKRVAKTIENGLDPLDPVIDAKNRLDAYKDGERAIFMGDNAISKTYEAGMKVLENSKSSSAQNIAALTRILLPFVKVPTNIALSSARYSFGLIPGLGKLAQVGASTLAKKAGAESIARIIHKGMGELTPEESDLVLRNLKHGSVGGAALLVGFFNPQNVGGYYQPGEKRKPKDAGAGAFKVFGEKIPVWMTEAPIFQAMQIGATFRRVLDAHRHKDDRIGTAALATASGLAEAIPLAKEAKQVTDMFGNDTHKVAKFISGAIKGEIEPAFLQQVAIATDTKNKDAFSFSEQNQQKRQPDKKHGALKYIGQDLETGVPGLRQRVPKKH